MIVLGFEMGKGHRSRFGVSDQLIYEQQQPLTLEFLIFIRDGIGQFLKPLITCFELITQLSI